MADRQLIWGHGGRDDPYYIICPYCKERVSVKRCGWDVNDNDKNEQACIPCINKNLAARHKKYGLAGKPEKLRVVRPLQKNDALLYKYGMKAQDYEAMHDAQDGRCAVCKCSHTEYDLLVVDHDHETGMVRGLLCQNCNHMLGCSYDNPAVLRLGANYLQTANTKFRFRKRG